MLSELFGRLHILLLHLPIGILLLVALFEWFHFWKFSNVPKETRTLTYAIGSISALFACMTGYWLSRSGDYAEGMVNNHMWAGIGATIVAFVFSGLSWKKPAQSLHWPVLILVAAIGITGHLGGSLTHGEGFLTHFSEADENRSAVPVFDVPSLPEARVYPDLIRPVLEAKCVGCHGSSKQKGKLRLDEIDLIRKGGKSGKPLIEVRAEESEMVHRIELPLHDDDHMPPEQKMQINERELQLLRWWLDNGSNLEASLRELEASDSVYQMIEQLIATAHQTDERELMKVIPAFLPAADLEKPSEAILRELASHHIIALEAGAGSPFLELNFVNVKKVEPIHWELLEKVAPHIVRLKMSDLEIKDQDLVVISRMKNLLRLYLDGTTISDEGLKHLKGLAQLQVLNINHTDASDEGLKALENLKELKTIYAFQSNVGMDSLSSGTKIIRGGYSLPLYETDTVRIPEY